MSTYSENWLQLLTNVINFFFASSFWKFFFCVCVCVGGGGSAYVFLCAYSYFWLHKWTSKLTVFKFLLYEGFSCEHLLSNQWYVSYSEKPNKMQQCIKILLFLILNEAQHVSGDTPPIIRSLKLHKQPLVLHTWKAVRRLVVYATWQRATTARPTAFHVCKTRGCQCSSRLLMMGGVASRWVFHCKNYTMMHGSTNIQWYVLMARVIQNTRASRPLSHYHTCDGGLLSLWIA